MVHSGVFNRDDVLCVMFCRVRSALCMLAAPAAASDYGVVTMNSRGLAGVLAACDAPGVVASIGERFAYQDAHIVHSGVAITGIEPRP